MDRPGLKTETGASSLLRMLTSVLELSAACKGLIPDKHTEASGSNTDRSYEKTISDGESHNMKFIDIQQQYQRYRSDIDARMHQVLEAAQFIMGPEVQELEGVLADYVGVRHCITTGSGTVSLEIALRALGIGPGDEVITVPFTWISTAEVIAQVGAKPVFVDIDATTYNMDASLLEAGHHPAYQGHPSREFVRANARLCGNQCYCCQAWLARHRGCRSELWSHPGGSTQLRGLVDWDVPAFFLPNPLDVLGMEVPCSRMMMPWQRKCPWFATMDARCGTIIR